MFNIILIIIWLLILTYAFSGIRGAIWVPTRKKDVQRFLKLAEIQPGQKMYDLGCGDGRLVFAAAAAGANATGYDISIVPFILAQIRKQFQKNKQNISILYRDLWGANLEDADLVYFFHVPKIHNRIKEKLVAELKPGTKVIAYAFPIEGWTPIKTDTEPNQLSLYLYKV